MRNIYILIALGISLQKIFTNFTNINQLFGYNLYKILCKAQLGMFNFNKAKYFKALLDAKSRGQKKARYPRWYNTELHNIKAI